MDRLPDAAVPVRPHALADDERRVGEPGRMLESAAVDQHEHKGRDRREALRPPTIFARISFVSSGVAAWRGGRCIRRGSAGSRSKATDVERSMKNSIHRIWSGIRTCRSTDEDRRDEDEAEERDVGRDEEDEPLLRVVDDPPALGQPEHQRGERVVAKDEIGCLAGDRRAGAHRDRDVGAVERRRVVDPVAGHGDDAAAAIAQLERSGASAPASSGRRRAGPGGSRRAGRRPTTRPRRP